MWDALVTVLDDGMHGSLGRRQGDRSGEVGRIDPGRSAERESTGVLMRK